MIIDNKIKGIILAGGSGSRLSPLTRVISKQLLPVYNKPMIYYPLETLINSGINDILIITTENDLKNFEILLGNGDEWNINLSYKVQKKPEGIAQALIIAEEWINQSPVVLILGDNLFFGPNLDQVIFTAINKNEGATIFCKEVVDPNRFGVVSIDQNFNILAIDEKPKRPKSNYAVTGLYIYDENVSMYAKELKKSERGELEITDLNKIYLNKNKLLANFLTKEHLWLDSGTFDTLLEASNYVKSIS
jgi:glucose-1-phosphate thymidylyltransferase